MGRGATTFRRAEPRDVCGTIATDFMAGRPAVPQAIAGTDSCRAAAAAAAAPDTPTLNAPPALWPK
jgi:hypothetical protein